MKQRKVKFLMTTGLVLCVLGVAGIAPTIYFNKTKRGTHVAAQAFPEQQIVSTPVNSPLKHATSGHPVSISIPSVGINSLTVLDGVFDSRKQDWSLGLHTAHWATITPLPNDAAGNSLIYGHYRPEVFAYLHNIKPGAEAYVDTDNGHRFVYVFKESVEVSPTDTSLFGYQGAPMLTVQTCSGSWFQNRQLFKFDFAYVEDL